MKDKLLVNTLEYSRKAELELNKIIEMSDKFDLEEEMYVDLIDDVSKIANKLFNQINFPTINNLNLSEIIEAIKFSMENITEIDELNYTKKFLMK